MMIFLSIVIVVVCTVVAIVVIKRRNAEQEIAKFSITPADLHLLMGTSGSVLVVDVRFPLDLLADPHIIPGSVRFPPKEVQANPSIIPRDRDVVFYCTCPSDGTSRDTLHKAHEAHHSRVKFLRGGLAAWKAAGFPVENYETAFHLDTL